MADISNTVIKILNQNLIQETVAVHNTMKRMNQCQMMRLVCSDECLNNHNVLLHRMLTFQQQKHKHYIAAYH